MPLDPGEQQFFEVGLVEHVRLREAVLAGLVAAAELGHDAVAGVEQAQPAAGPGPGQESFADADPVQGPGDLVVQVYRAGQGVGLGVAFQQGDGDPGIGEQEGAVQPAGPAPTAMTGFWVAGFWSFTVVSFSRQVSSRRSGRRATARSGR